MTELGDIICGKSLGIKTSNNYQWLLCPNCNKPRWVRLMHGHPRGLVCKPCSDHKRRIRADLRITTKKGYTAIYLYPEDFFYPMAEKSGYVFEHRLVMAKYLRRCLQTWEFVHHVNGVKNDNRIENLKLIMGETHNAFSIFANRIQHLEERITVLETENTKLKEKLNAR